jgi:hypothetical protein
MLGGQEFLYWSDGGSYVIVSGGADGRLDRSYQPPDEETSSIGDGGAQEDPAADVIFWNGSFVQWPDLRRR